MKKEAESGSKIESVISSAEKYGLDLTLLYENLRLTPTERLEQLKRLLRFSEELQKAGQRKRQ